MRLMRLLKCLCLVAVFCVLLPSPSPAASYLGEKACAPCHETQYENFKAFAKKARSYDSIRIMASDLTPEELETCFSCHSTGYGEPGGFVSIETTPELANAGCEVCHGPGSEHVDSGGDPEMITRTMTLANCERCHNAERVTSFNFKPLLYGGAH